MTRTLPALAAAAATAALAAGALAAVPSGSASAAPGDRGPKVFGLTADGDIATFRANDPGNVLRTRAVNGLQDDTEIVGIDVRPATGKLFALGDEGGLYQIANKTGNATLVNELTVELDGSDFDIDFNPAVDRLRIVSDTGQNLRHDPNANGTGTITDGSLTVAGSNPPTPVTGITAAAYTNNDATPATGTLLFDLNAATDVLVTQTPANAGAITTIGGTGADIAPDAGFDIESTLGDSGGTVGNVGYVVTDDTLYTIDLSTGLLTSVGDVDAEADVVDLAVKQGPTAL